MITNASYKSLAYAYADHEAYGKIGLVALCTEYKNYDAEEEAREKAERPAKLRKDYMKYINMIRTEPQSFIPIIKENRGF